MGLLDTFRHVFGRHGVTVRFKSIERQPPDSAEMPIHDTVVKAQLLIHAERETTIESVSIRWMARRMAADGSVREEIELAMDENPEPGVAPGPGMTAFPLALAAGQTHEEGMSVFLEGERDLPAFYREHGWRHAETRFAIVATVVVYGSFSDATCEAPLRIIAIEDLDG